MRRLVIAVLVVLGGLALAGSALALDVRPHKAASLSRLPVPFRRLSVTTVLGCDDGNPYSAYYQGTDDRIGNVFNFGGGAVLSRVAFMHYGYGYPGPYNYDLELWDPTTCTFIASKDNLKAADAANSLTVDVAELCDLSLFVTGDVAVMIDPNSCISASDCYPDIVFDDQLGVTCPMIIANASTSPTCFDYSPYSGPFFVQVETDNCPTPSLHRTWGNVKSFYR